MPQVAKCVTSNTCPTVNNDQDASSIDFHYPAHKAGKPHINHNQDISNLNLCLFIHSSLVENTLS